MLLFFEPGSTEAVDNDRIIDLVEQMNETMEEGDLAEEMMAKMMLDLKVNFNRIDLYAEEGICTKTLTNNLFVVIIIE